MIRELICKIRGHDWQGGYWKWWPTKYVHYEHLVCHRCGEICQ